MKKLLVAVLCLFGLTVATDARFPRGVGAVVFTHVPIGGAGAVIGVSSVPSHNLLFARTDQFNCYMSTSTGTPSQWVPLITATNAPVSQSTITSSGFPLVQGSGACVGAPSTATDIWVEILGNIFFSTDQGVTFSASCYPYQSDQGNSQISGKKILQNVIAIDPANPNIVYMGTSASTLQVTYNKGVSCFSLSGSVGTTAGNGNYLTSFSSDLGTTLTCPHSASICTKHVFVSTYDTGTYESIDGGVTWTLRNAAGAPTTFVASRADPFGNLFVVDDTGGPHGRGDGGGTLRVLDAVAHTWSTPSTGTAFALGIDYDPNSCASAGACHIALTSGGGSSSGQSYTTTGYAGTWYFTNSITTTSTDVPWLADFINAGFGQYSNTGAFDNSGRVHVGGEGAFYYTPVSAGGVTFISHTLGIEESLSTSVVTSSATSGKVHLATWDLNCFINMAMPYSSLPTTSNRGCYSTNGTGLQHINMIDWASADPSFFVALGDNQANYGGGGYVGFSGKSTDGGVTWTAINTPPRVSSNSLIGGCIAASSSTNYIWEATDNSGGLTAPYYTTNGGTTWNNIILANNTDELATSASTASGNAVLTFTSVPSWITVGQTSIYNKTTPTSTIGTVKVTGKTATTVMMSLNASATINSGDVILFSNGGWPNVDYHTQAFCTADRVNANTFYLYNWNDQVSGDAIVKCTSGGASCAVQSRPSMSGNAQFGAVIKAVPGNAGHLFLTNYGNVPPDGLNGEMFYYTDGGVTKNVVANMTGVVAYGFGAAFPGHTYPAIVCACFYNGVYGIWQSIDWDGAKTWQKIGTYPKNLGVTMEDIDGDKVIPNVFYYTTNSGVFCSAPSTAYCNGGT